MCDEGIVGLLDNDVIAHLGTCDLLGELQELIGVDRIQVLGSARHQMVRNPRRRMRDKLGDSGREAVSQFLEHAEEISVDDGDTDFLQRCQDAAIDNGEALLLDIARRSECYMLATGDKNFLRTLSADRDLLNEISYMQHRVMCFEQIIYLMIERWGYQRARAALEPLIDAGHQIRMVLATSGDDAEQHCMDGLASWIREAHSHVPELLCPIGTTPSEQPL